MSSLRYMVCAITLVLSLSLAACSAEENDPKVGQQTGSESPSVVSEEPSESAQPSESDYISSARPIENGDLPSAPPQGTMKTPEAPAAPPANSDARAAAQASCNDTMWTWPWCHISRPTIPRIHVSGPRPDLTPKDWGWCWAKYVKTDKDDMYWELASSTKIALPFWPDYYHRYYHLLAWSWKDMDWWVMSESVEVDCDA